MKGNEVCMRWELSLKDCGRWGPRDEVGLLAIIGDLGSYLISDFVENLSRKFVGDLGNFGRYYVGNFVGHYVESLRKLQNRGVGSYEWMSGG